MAEERGANPLVVFREQLNARQSEFLAALPAQIPVERFMRVVMTAVQTNPGLLNCDRRSLWNACMKAAQDGLLPDGRDGAIVEYKNQAQWMPMIGGIRKKVRNSGEITTWDVHAVYENDEFDFELGDDPFIRHKPKLGDRGEIIAVYSVAKLKGGEISRDVMGIDEVEKIRAISRSKNGPWANPTFYPEMAKKTVARRHSKVLPMSTDLDDLIRRDDALYDLEGSSDKVQRGEPAARLGSRLAALAAPTEEPVAFDRETGEIREEVPLGGDDDDFPGDRQEMRREPPRDERREDRRDTRQQGGDEPTGDEIEAARDMGAEAYFSGKSRRAVPQNYRGTALERHWLAAFDEAKNDDGQTGQGGDQ